MNTRSTILCVFEGEKREHQYFKTLQGHYFDDDSILVCSYGNDIYELFRELSNDPDLDIVELIRESKNVQKNKNILAGYSREDFNQVFLFFDFEYQDEQFNVETLYQMISIFNEETENGKLFISYPMIEAIRDVPSIEGYINHKVNLIDCVGKIYKSLSSRGLQDFQDPRKITKQQWDKLIEINVIKANFITNKGINNLTDHPEQDEILLEQSKIMESSHYIYVLSSFPLFIFHQKSSQLIFNPQE